MPKSICGLRYALSRTLVVPNHHIIHSGPPSIWQRVAQALIGWSLTRCLDEVGPNGTTAFLSTHSKQLYSTTKETHQSLLGPIMEIRIKKWKYIYTIFCSIQVCIILLNNVTVLLKSVHAVCHCLDKGSFSKMTSFSLENKYLVLV